MTLRKKAVSGIKWSAVLQASKRGTRLLTTIILARLLSPSDFGLVGMAMVLIGFVSIFEDLGTSAAIIQRKKLSEELLSSIFWVNIGFGTLSMVVLFLGAPLGGLLYNESRIDPILRVLSLTFFISSFSNLQQALLERALAFKKLAKVEISAAFCGSIVGVGLAFYGCGVWSLVFQLLTTVSVTTTLLWFVSTWRPKWIFDWKEVQSVSNYSIHLVGTDIIGYFARNADYLLIGRYLGAQDLGYYTLAYRILLFPLKNISSVIGRVMFPVYSSIQDDNKRFSNTYLKVAKTIALISFPLMMGILILAEPFVLTVLGSKWKPITLLIMIFAPLGIIQSIGTTVGTIYYAKGRTDWAFRWSIAANVYLTFSFFIGLHWGIIGVAVSYAIASFSISYISFAIPFRLIDLKVSRLLAVLWKPFVNSLVMFAAVMVFKNVLLYLLSNTMLLNMLGFSGVLSNGLKNTMLLGLSVVFGIAIYGAESWATNREQLKELWELVGFARKGQDAK